MDDNIRNQFPALSRKIYGHDLVYLDNTATSQTPRAVVERLVDAYYDHHANVHRGVHCLAGEATAAVEDGRRHVARYINAASTSEIVFTRGTTEAINLVASSYCSLLSPGDEIIITVMEHHSNIVPWQLAAQRHGLVIKVVPLNADGATLDLDAYGRLFSDRTRVVAFAHVSNVLGTINSAKEIIAEAHRHGAVVLVDGAQATPHLRVDVRDLDADFYVFSSHKMYGPTGVGVLYGREKLLSDMPPYQGGGEMIGHVSLPTGTTYADLPFKFEAGTPDFTAIAAFDTALSWIEQTGMEKIASHEQSLLDYATAQMKETVPGVRIFGEAAHKSAVISFLIGDAHPYDTGLLLDKLGIAVRTGHHCAQPLMEALGIEGTVRASFAVYNTRDEVDRFILALQRIAPMLI
ncbi:MAG: cysteine desulfurase [Muribaculaceae bacterium]|nr:cysteine desulfurase [Muribaculaceae bacterium]